MRAASDFWRAKGPVVRLLNPSAKPNGSPDEVLNIPAIARCIVTIGVSHEGRQHDMRHDEPNAQQHLRLFKAKTMWIPDPIYKKLPLVYTAAGAALIPAFGATTPIVVSSLMFLAAAVLTYFWRRQHQQEPEPVPQSTLRDEWAQRRARRIQSMKVKT